MYLCIKLFSVSVCLSLLSIKLSTTHLHHPPLSPCLSMYVSLLLSVSLCIFLSVCFYLFVSVSPCLSLSPFMSLSLYVSLCFSLPLSVSIYLYLSVCLSVSHSDPLSSLRIVSRSITQECIQRSVGWHLVLSRQIPTALRSPLHSFVHRECNHLVCRSWNCPHTKGVTPRGHHCLELHPFASREEPTVGSTVHSPVYGHFVDPRKQ